LNQTLLFPIAEFWWLYGAFICFVIGMLALDLGVFHKHSHTVGFKEASLWSLTWVTLALLFNLGLYYLALHIFKDATVAKEVALEFFTGYLIEKSLSIDNIFIFVVVFGFFAIPPKLQHRVLFFGILGALIFRAIFIALGSLLIQYHPVVLIFGSFLIFTGIRMMIRHETQIDPSSNWLIRILKRRIRVIDHLESDHFFIKHEGLTYASPLFIALLVLEMTDIIFAIDSVPAIFAITKEPLIVFTSNIFAILGLRSLYFLLAGVIPKFHLLKYGLAMVLIFVGLKMVWLNDQFDGKFPTTWSLVIIASCIGGSIIASLLIKPHNKGT